MDKNAIKKYAVWARRELISRVSTKALQYGITEQDCGNPDDDSVNGILLTDTQKNQRQALIAQIKEKGYQEVMEEVAYTWFNRFSALRFMEVNGYLPTHVRVFTDGDNAFNPQIITEAIHLEVDGLDMEKVYAYKEAGEKDELYKYLLIAQCNALSPILPGMFQKIEDYTELLFPDNLLREGSAIEQMITLIPEEDWRDAVQIIGWLYQYYNAEKKDDVFAALKKNVKITKANIPAATQLFTPDWIVRYMVENSLGRLWLEGHPNAELQSDWKYYLEEAEQEPEVQTQLAAIRKEYEGMKPEEIKCIDPCCGSGHILAYMFDVLMQIYEAYGYTTREAVSSIVKNNLYGLDIDDRAAQLASFAMMMKARQYDRRFFARKDENGNLAIPQPHVYAIMEPIVIGGSWKLAMGDFLLSKEHQKTLNYLLDAFLDAKEYGSILQLEERDYAGLLEAWKYTASQTAGNFNMTLWYAAVEHQIPKLIGQAIMLTQKYDVVVTNPPYMGSSGMSTKLGEYVKKNYPNSKSDLFACFIERCGQMVGENGYQAMITQHAWMFLSSFEKLRTKLLQVDTVNMAHLGARAFEEIGGEVVQTTSFVIRKSHIEKYKGTYCRLTAPTSQQGKDDMFLAGEDRYTAEQDSFSKIPGAPIAYWWKDFSVFDFPTIKGTYESAGRNKTHGNERFVRNWWEISDTKKWKPYANGGVFRRWAGNDFDVVDWSDEARATYASHGGLYNQKYNGKQGICWNLITSYKNGFRLKHPTHHYSSGAPTIIAENSDSDFTTLAFLNSVVAITLLQMFNPTLNTTVGDVLSLPLKENCNDKINSLSRVCVILSQTDWDSFETSWDFQRHPLIDVIPKNSMVFDNINDIDLAECFMMWENECNERFNQLKANEEELNRIFIDIYGLSDELTPEVEDKDVTVRKADLQRDIKSLISYTVGCMFGRYSLDESGLILAGQPFDEKFVYASVPLAGTGVAGDPASFTYTQGDCYFRVGKDIKQCTFAPDKDNIIPICDDEYFEDDIVGRLVKFIEVVYGKDSLERNLKFIAAALGGKGQPKDIIRNYFMNEFYNDHCKMYQKRPIYWLFDSGKKNGFKALIYMHRYQPDTIARIRTDYVHEQQGRYRTAIADLQNQIESASTSERVKLKKRLTALQAQAEEILSYEEKIHHLADQMIPIDLDDGVRANYAKFQDVLAKIK